MDALFPGHEYAGVRTADSHEGEVGEMFCSGPVYVGGGFSIPQVCHFLSNNQTVSMIAWAESKAQKMGKEILQFTKGQPCHVGLARHSLLNKRAGLRRASESNANKLNVLYF